MDCSLNSPGRCLKIIDTLRNFMFGPQYSEYWSSHIQEYKARMAQAISPTYVPLSRRD